VERTPSTAPPTTSTGGGIFAADALAARRDLERQRAARRLTRMPDASPEMVVALQKRAKLRAWLVKRDRLRVEAQAIINLTAAECAAGRPPDRATAEERMARLARLRRKADAIDRRALTLGRPAPATRAEERDTVLPGPRQPPRPGGHSPVPAPRHRAVAGPPSPPAAAADPSLHAYRRRDHGTRSPARR
jgi:hypothetical protein